MYSHNASLVTNWKRKACVSTRWLINQTSWIFFCFPLFRFAWNFFVTHFSSSQNLMRVKTENTMLLILRYMVFLWCCYNLQSFLVLIWDFTVVHVHANINISALDDEVPYSTPTGILKKSPPAQVVYKSSKLVRIAIKMQSTYITVKLLGEGLDCLLSISLSFLSQNPLQSVNVMVVEITMNELNSCECSSWHIIFKKKLFNWWYSNPSWTKSPVVATINSAKRRFLLDTKPIFISKS